MGNVRRGYKDKNSEHGEFEKMEGRIKTRNMGNVGEGVNVKSQKIFLRDGNSSCLYIAMITEQG